MKINTTETVYQFFSLKHQNPIFNLKYNNQELPKSENIRYLGIIMDNKLSWKEHIKQVRERVNSRMKLLKRLAGITRGSTQDTLNTTYKTYIKQIIKYGSDMLVSASK